jgi:hypothetical protein
MAANMVDLERDTYRPPGIDNIARCYHARFSVALQKYESSAPGVVNEAFEICE